MGKLLILSFFYFLSSCFLYAQVTYTLADTTVVNRLIRESSDLDNSGKFDLSYFKIDSAETIYNNIFKEKKKGLAIIYYAKGRILFQKNKYQDAREYLKKYLTILIKSIDKPQSDIANAFYIIGLAYERENVYDLAIENVQKAIEIDTLTGGNINVSKYYYLLGNIYSQSGRNDEANQCYQKALNIKIILLGSKHVDVASTLINLGALYQFNGEHDKAIEYYQKGLNIYIYNKAIDHVGYHMAINNIGAAYMDKGDTENALKYGKEALEIRLNIPVKNDGYIASSYSNIGNAYRYKKEYDKALENLFKALELKMKVMKPNNPILGTTLTSIGYCYDKLNQPEKAMEYLERGIAIFIKKDEKVGAIVDLANVKIKLGAFFEADSLFKQSLNIVQFNGVENIEKATSLKGISRILPFKAAYEYARFEATKDISFLKKSIKTYTQAIEVIDYRSKIFIDESSKAELKKQQFQVYEGVIKSDLMLLKIMNRNDIVSRSFDYSEKIKAGLLQAQLKESHALKFANIHDDVLKTESQLRLNITWQEKQKQEKLNAGKSETDSTVLTISSKLFDLRQSYDSLKQNLEKNYPDYYRLKYDSKTVSVDDLQKKMLSPQQTLLSYFVGDSTIFAFVVRPDTFAVFTINKDFPLELYIKQLRDGLYGYQTAAVKTEKLYEMKADSFVQAAFQLHEKLIRPLSILLKKEVILVPDGVLGYVPFDVLLSEKPKDATKFNTHRYFGKEHIISYNYSATLWHSMQNKKHKTEPTKNFVGFAPYYNGDTTVLSQIFSSDLTMRKELDSLKYSGEEVFKAQKLMGGEAVLNAKATKKTFEETVGNYRIIHLATHGKANDKAGDYCFLAFADQKDSIDNELLYVRDIYNLSLNADLVVLSACETGIGELKRGEGIVSLARAFAYAGAKSMVTTLWSVNDKSTMQIMENFYRNLRKGQTKSYALWKAKQDYLERAKGEFSHPFYWSSFIPIGDMKPVKM